MARTFCLYLFILHAGVTLAQTSDFTAQNIFSGNIEGPAVDKSGRIYVVNFQRDGTIGRVNAKGKVKLHVSLPDGSIANSIQLNSNGDLFLADFTGHNILKVDKDSKIVSVFAHRDDFNQPNDLCINRRNQLFASDPNWKEATGKIWRIDPSGEVVLLADDMGTTNGIELSPDEKTLYVNESAQRKIWAFDVDDAGSISNKRLFTDFADFGLDGMKCDRAGNLYITRYGKGAIAVFTESGEFIREIKTQGLKCSNLVFGGKTGKTIFITLQDRKGMEKFENSIPGKGW
jgi:gluconolactonase